MEINLKHRGILMTEQVREHVRRKVQYALGRLESKIRAVSVRLADINGPRGGVDKLCSIEVEAAGGLGRIIVAERQRDLYAAIALASERAGRSLRRQVETAGERQRSGGEAAGN